MLFRQDPYYGHLLSLSWLELALTSTPRPVLSVQGHDSDMGQMSSLANLGLPPDAKCRVTVTFSSCFQLSHCFPHYSEHSSRKLSLSKAQTPGSSEEGETGQLSNWRHATRDGSCDGGNEHVRKASLHPPLLVSDIWRSGMTWVRAKLQGKPEKAGDFGTKWGVEQQQDSAIFEAWVLFGVSEPICLLKSSREPLFLADGFMCRDRKQD